MSVPPNNPTTPSEATLSISPTVNGTIIFRMADPVVRPRETRFQIIRSTVSSNAAAGTVVWDGAIQTADITCPNCVHYYFSRAYANSYFGPYSPNTTGLAGRPAPIIYTWHVDTLAASTIS